MHIPAKVIADAVNAIINARDFCADEREAAREVFLDAGITDREDIARGCRVANFRANAEWRVWQKRAGVPAKYIY